MNEHDDVRAPGTAAPPPHDELQRALAELTSERQRRLSALIDEARRCDELLAALPAAAGQAVQAQRRQLDEDILGLLMAWRSLGGSILLDAPAPPGASQAAAEPTPAQPEPTPVRPSAAPAQPPAPSASPEPPRPWASHRPEPRHPQREPIASEAHEPAGDWAEDLAALLDSVMASTNAQEEMEAIQRAASGSFSRWVPYPRSVQRALVGNLACRLRHLQDFLGVTGMPLDSAFRSLTRFSKSFQPGWVNGLTRGRGPAAESWAEEARVWWDQLALSAQRSEDELPTPATGPAPLGGDEALDVVRSWLGEWREAPEVAKPMCLDKTLGAIQEALDAGVPHTDPVLCRLADEIYDHLELARFRRLRQGIRDLELADREEQGLEPPEALPSDWSWWSHTVGRRALLLGASLEAERLELVEGAFGLAELRCHELEPGPPSDEQLRGLLGGGGIDLVLLVGEHPGEPQLRAMIRACQVRGLPWVHVTLTPGVTRVRMAIERFLQPDPKQEGTAP